MVWEGGSLRSSQILVVVVSRGFGFFLWRSSQGGLLWFGRGGSLRSSQILEWSPVVGGGGGVLRELSRDGLPWIGGSRGSSQILVAMGPPGRGGGVLRAIPKRWWK